MVLSLMLVIVDEEQTDKITRFFRDHLTRFQYVAPAFGTANSELLALLGLGETCKSVVISLMPKQQADLLIDDIPKSITLGKRTKGLVFTLPLTGVSNTLLGSFNPEFLMKLFEELGPERQSHLLGMFNIKPGELTAELLQERMLNQMEHEPETCQLPEDAPRNDLIVAIVNQDTSEELMEVAKAAGAGGGTVVNARRVGLDDDNTFMGMPIQAKKEVILILTERKKKMAIMKAVNHSFGLNTQSHGLIFSIPVDCVAWIS
jgi:nitrogen regulatory protein PII